MFVGTVYFRTDLLGPVCVCMLPGVNPSTDLCQPSSHLSLSGNDRRVRSPTVSSLPSYHPPATHARRLPVSPSRVVPSEDLVSQSGPPVQKGVTYGTVEAATATCGAYSDDGWKQLPY